MPRIVTVGIAQLGPIPRTQSRPEVVLRLLALMEDAAKSGCDLIVYPEAALTAFFPHWMVEGDQELDSYFESEMPNAAVQPLFDAARRLRIGFHLGYLTTHQFYPDAHSGGRGSPKVSSLTMRRRPLVNHDSRLRLMFLG